MVVALAGNEKGLKQVGEIKELKPMLIHHAPLAANLMLAVAFCPELNKNYMKINELRIGNYLLDDSNRLCIVSTMNENGSTRVNAYNKSYHYESFDISRLNPILLKEQLLVNWGFIVEKNGDEEIEWNEYLIETPLFNLNLKFDGEYYCFHCDYGLSKIKYLHQLQNLYFSLIGKEIEIEL